MINEVDAIIPASVTGRFSLSDRVGDRARRHGRRLPRGDTRLDGSWRSKCCHRTTIDADRHRRFVREAQSASALNHPNIVTIYDIGDDAGTTFIVMELVEGATLDRVAREGAAAVATALDVRARRSPTRWPPRTQRASSIATSSPPTSWSPRDGRVKMLDFGLAKLIERAPTEATITAVGDRAGLVVGTAAYMSPEQAEGGRSMRGPTSSRSARCSTRCSPAGGRSAAARRRHLLDPARRAAARAERALDVPAEVERIVQRALAKDPAGRYPDAAAMRAWLGTAHCETHVGRSDSRLAAGRRCLIPVGVAC